MRDDNGWYSHRASMNAYIGRWTEPRPIYGTLDHGWTYHFRPLGNLSRLKAPYFVWNRRHLLEGQRYDNPVKALGAPFIYGASALGLDDIPQTRPAGTLFVPIQQADPSFWRSQELAGLLDSFEENFPRPYMISVLPRDFPKIEDMRWIADRGWRFCTNGFNHDPWFLHRMVNRFLTVSHVVADRPCTQMMCAAYLGNRVAVVPPERSLTGVRDELAHQFPDLPTRLFTEGLEPNESREMGRSELGKEYQIGPEQLIAELGLVGWRQLAAVCVREALDFQYAGFGKLLNRKRLDSSLQVWGAAGRPVIEPRIFLNDINGASRSVS